jgi:pimeloyl-ACP methyl ester carboxylesterase
MDFGRTVQRRVYRAMAALLLVCATLPAAAGVRSSAPESGSQGSMSAKEASLRVGSMLLHRCETPAPWCGTLDRPLDPDGRVAERIEVYFEFYPHTGAGPARGTLVATEGGPGYPATESREEYLAFLAPLRATRDIVLMDNRGTGRSAPINCVPLQTDPAITEENVAACGRQLGERAALYSDALAADDLAALLDALALGPIDLYGDSAGTFFEQVFAARQGGHLRSLILDGAYPLGTASYAWYPNYAPAMRDKFNLACQRSAACNALPGSSLDRISRVLAALRSEPFAAQGPDGDGRPVHFTANATQLATVMFGSAPAYASIRELDAAARAFSDGDKLPLLRLMAETQVSVDSRDPTRSPAQFSSGLAAVVMCHDAPQIYDMNMPPEARAARRDQLIAGRERSDPHLYAPFTFAEYRGMPLDYAFLDECARWPAATRNPAGLAEQLAPANAADVPALVISGDLDNMTPVADGALAAARFRRGRQIIVPNGLHVNALPHARSECPAKIARQFIATLQVPDPGCLQQIPEVRLLPGFARRLQGVAAATAMADNAANELQLRAAGAALLAVADIIDRLGSNASGRGVGLRGGDFSVQRPEPLAASDHDTGDAAYRISLRNIRWTEDLAVSGQIDWPGRSGAASADLHLSGAEAVSGALQLHWSEGVAQALAIIQGQLGGNRVAAQAAAP